MKDEERLCYEHQIIRIEACRQKRAQASGQTCTEPRSYKRSKIHGAEGKREACHDLFGLMGV